MENRERERELLESVEGAGGESRVLLLKDGGNPAGYAAVELLDGTLRILRLSAGTYDFSRPPTGEELFLLDTLMRSAASYGEHFGASFLETSFPDFFGFFAARGFQTDEKHAFTPMNTIVRYE